MLRAQPHLLQCLPASQANWVNSSGIKGLSTTAVASPSERMVFEDDLLQPHFENVGVNLRCRNVGVAKQLLHRTQIGAAIQQVTCERMPEDMW
jgi:hypothetical protein